MSGLSHWPEQDEWLKAHTRPRYPERREPNSPAPPAPECPFTDAEIAWLWPRFQKCGHGSGGSFAKSFARNPLEKLTPKGKACLAAVAHRFRRQIFANSDKMTLPEFIATVKARAS